MTPERIAEAKLCARRAKEKSITWNEADKLADFVDEIAAALEAVTVERDTRWRKMRKAVWSLVNETASFSARYRCGVDEALGEIDRVAREDVTDDKSELEVVSAQAREKS